MALSLPFSTAASSLSPPPVCKQYLFPFVVFRVDSDPPDRVACFNDQASFLRSTPFPRGPRGWCRSLHLPLPVTEQQSPLELRSGNSPLRQVLLLESTVTVQSILITENYKTPLLMVCWRQGSQKKKKRKKEWSSLYTQLFPYRFSPSPHFP